MSKNSLLWVVYKPAMRGTAEGINAVCEQAEWDAMELAKPGQNQLIQTGITNEGEAERLARGTSGDSLKRRTRENIAALIQRPAMGESAVSK